MTAPSHSQPIYYYVDHTSRFQHNSGIQRCVRALGRALLELGQPLVPVVWERERQQLVPASPEALAHLARWSGPAPDSWAAFPMLDAEATPGSAAAPRSRWLLLVELVSGPHNPSWEQLETACQRLGLRMAWLFHDAIPLTQAHLYGAAASQAASSHATYMANLARAARVFCNSHTSRRHLLSFLHETLPQQQGRATWAGLEQRVRALPLAEEFGDQRLPPPARTAGEPLQLLCVSTLEPRKNHRGLIKALAWLHSKGLRQWQLQLVGWAAEGWVVALVKRAQRLGLPVQWHGRADDQTLLELYQRCHLSVYPSLEEGFGLPVAESLWQRRPCLCSGDGALGERAAAGGCLTVDTSHWRAIAAGLERLLLEPELRQQLEREADARPFRRWSTVAAELLEGLQPCEL